MGKAIQIQGLGEGEIFCKWLYSRLIKNNKNVLGAELGATGSGKSYRDLRKIELWYKYYLKEKVPTENICFGVPTVMQLISSGKLRKGEVIIFEEAGANLGSLDFQNKVSKMMTYVLQSFRSMNIGIFFNLPYLSMLNKTARMLLHYSFESAGIDQQKKINKCKPKFHQVNQTTGKIYFKYPIVKVNSRTRKVKRFSFSLPSKYLIDAYEKKKAQYLSDLTNKYNKELDIMVNGKDKSPEEIEFKAYGLYRLTNEGKRMYSQEKIANMLNISQRSVCNYIKRVEKYNMMLEEEKNAKGIGILASKSRVVAPTI